MPAKGGQGQDGMGLEGLVMEGGSGSNKLFYTEAGQSMIPRSL